MKLSTRTKGNYAEDRAINYLQSRGFTILERNYYTKYGEIDIIATFNNVYHFIEVKSCKSFNPLLNITQLKLEKIYKSIAIYLSNHDLEVEYCLDAISVEDNIELFENITMQF